MLTYTYPALVEEIEAGDFLVRFPDVPEAITGGDDLKAALTEAPDALAAAVEGYLERGWVVPLPSEPPPGAHSVALDPVLAARVVLARVMTERRLSQSALAQQLGRDEKAVRRMLSGKGASLDLLLTALRALGVPTALAA